MSAVLNHSYVCAFAIKCVNVRLFRFDSDERFSPCLINENDLVTSDGGRDVKMLKKLREDFRNGGYIDVLRKARMISQMIRVNKMSPDHEMSVYIAKEVNDLFFRDYPAATQRFMNSFSKSKR